MKTTTLCALSLTLLPLTAAGSPSPDMPPGAPQEACRVDAALLQPAPVEGLAGFRGVQDASGQHLVLVKGKGPAYALHAYTRDAATGQYARRGIYSIVSQLLPLTPASFSFDEGGVSLTLRRSTDDGKTLLEYQHRFSYEQAEAGVEFMADTRMAHYAWRALNGQPFAFWNPAVPVTSQEKPGMWPGDWVWLSDKPEPAASPAACRMAPPMWRGEGAPDNRVSRALRSAMYRKDWEKNPGTMPFTWYDGWGEELLAEGAEVPEEKLVELWYSAQMNIAFCHNWFCDAAGENLVFVSDMSSGATTTDLTAYRWDAQKKVFIKRGTYTVCSRWWHDVPIRVGFDEAGMRVELAEDYYADRGTTLRVEHHFDYARPYGCLDAFVGDRELVDVLEDELAGERHSRQWELTPLGSPQPPATGRESGITLPQAVGGQGLMAVGGSLLEDLKDAAAEEAVGTLGWLPDNRVTRALNSSHPWRSQDSRNMEAEEWVQKPGSFIPLEQLPALWSTAYCSLYYDDSPGWFCDEAGEHLVIICRKFVKCYCYVLHVFVWDAERGGFEQRASHMLACGSLQPVPTRTEFHPTGMRLCCMSFGGQSAPEESYYFIHYADKVVESDAVSEEL